MVLAGLVQGRRPPGQVVEHGDRRHPFAVIAFTVANGRIAAIDLIADPDKLSSLTVSSGAG